MTRSVWLKADDTVGDWETRKRRITSGLEAGVDWVLVDEDDVEQVRELGDVKIAAFRSDADVHVMEAEEDDEAEALADAYIVGKDGEGDATVDLPSDFSGSADLTTLRRSDDLANGSYVRILSKDYEAFAEEAARDGDHTIVVGEDWTIIPLENLIARIGEETDLIAGVTSAEEAKAAFETLEIGSDGVLLDSDDPDEIRKTVEIRDEAERESLDLVWAEVQEVERTGMADRVCVDTGSLMDHEEGMLVGSMSRGLFFVHAETAESPYVASRPFRVNAGAVHAYARTPNGGTTYLSELESGDEVQVVDTKGRTREAIVGRVKIEKRPMFRISADYEGDRVTTLLQNAETIKVHTREGRTAVTDLEPGDEMLIYYEDTARHFGEAVEESIIEK
ncbi:3-dehydroquinate synthase II [Haloferax mediterranei ATCC 33500]|uniref:3-dehydroquinate synthase n=1 Tax=Haloferax mediterranei (strain ATCC 33500 / DSM 1411 / JCM 8866 / NBRC 14739 / NCIMB 2177 / R-4) TaxID=523841 RepID=I3R2M0_HALMT|nr:3-dehydroquinate synthase II [Haloferax mediterranei]AFK18480.2 3-dehydroquinate synthase [Haloferax mediterranei ATCC 33500]AHZ22138.1 3-dehydroquinate synthase [Haloferax mediterranei ATCC 33500]EMA02247.1 3-dehydroquinate synthase [Haloferax mediterranei ATCC 33500]MDX5988570.1 3-dehydroquinate synthase II [Haloferax mediterranei ATCC 33500]QCQ74984.1 3-dehydroquinate synthase II [Haloferax mediterranei ATCC 33500]